MQILVFSIINFSFGCLNPILAAVNLINIILSKLTQMHQLGKIRQFFSSIPKYKEALEKYYRKNQPINGFCTPEKSQKYASRSAAIHPDNWRFPKGIKEKLKISSLGLGTYNGPPSNEYDYQMFRAVVDSIRSGGVNVIDTCAMYRFGKSEKVINAALNYLINEDNFEREEFLISTKCGYIPHDIDSNLQELDFIRILTSEGIVPPEQIVNDVHCVHPGFLDFTVEKSRIGLGLETIDIVYLNNFSEAHLPIVGDEKTYERLKQAFKKFEEMRSQNRIKYYGISSYVGLRSPKTQTGVHFQLQKAIQLAKEVGGSDHGFRFLMVPFSLGTPEIMLRWQQYFDGKKTSDVRVFDIAEKEAINIVSCSPLFQGRVANVPFQNKKLDYLQHCSAKHLQLMRSFFSPALLTTLVGQTQSTHIEQNLSLLKHPLLTQKEWLEILPVPE